jgi:thymidylate kinase
MIIELFGPPGVGKTTFARTLAERLGERGHAMELVLSHRPAEQTAPLDPSARGGPARGRAAAAFQRIRRPLLEMLALVRRPSAVSGDVHTAINLVSMMPPTSIMWSIRLSQYLSRLSRSWQRASESQHIVLFDQAFVQAVSSLMLLGRAEDEALVSHVLDCAPKADLLIRLDAPREVLEARLRDRERSQSTLERLFELDLKSNLELIRIIDRLHALIEKRGETVARVNSVDPPSLELAAAQIEERLAAKLLGKVGAAVAS